jgi:hypothetical protein
VSMYSDYVTHAFGFRKLLHLSWSLYLHELPQSVSCNRLVSEATRFPSGELVDSIQLDSMFKKNGGGWNAYYKRYGSGMVTWSRVGFNADGTLALFYERYRCGGLCGTGRYMVMEKRNGGWLIGSNIVVWVS